MQNRPMPTSADYQKLLQEAREMLDRLRQLDNLMLYDLSNPPELEDARGRVLASMHLITGLTQAIEKRLRDAR